MLGFDIVDVLVAKASQNTLDTGTLGWSQVLVRCHHKVNQPFGIGEWGHRSEEQKQLEESRMREVLALQVPQ